MSMEHKQRLYHLDAVRCFCMLFGLWVHGATVGQNAFFTLIKDASGLFRMEAFYLVSGYFTALVCARLSLGAFYRNRTVVLLLPFLAGVLLLNPITNWLLYWFTGSRMGLGTFLEGGYNLPYMGYGHSVWHLHLWFLLPLYLYALLTPLFLKCLGKVKQYFGEFAQVGPFLLALSAAAATLLLRAAYDQFVHLPDTFSLSFIARSTFHYVPYFILGVAAWVFPSVFGAMHQRPWVALATFGSSFVAYHFVKDNLGHVPERILYLLTNTGLSVALIFMLLYLGKSLIRTGSAPLKFVTEAAYSFYIFHFIVIYMVACAAQLFTSNEYVIFSLILLVGYPLLLVLHHNIIAKRPLLRLLFNGKIT